MNDEHDSKDNNNLNKNQSLVNTLIRLDASFSPSFFHQLVEYFELSERASSPSNTNANDLSILSSFVNSLLKSFEEYVCSFVLIL